MRLTSPSACSAPAHLPPTQGRPSLVTGKSKGPGVGVAVETRLADADAREGGEDRSPGGGLWLGLWCRGPGGERLLPHSGDRHALSSLFLPPLFSGAPPSRFPSITCVSDSTLPLFSATSLKA